MTTLPKVTRLTIPNFRTAFCNLLQERFHAVIEHFLNLDNDFSLIINLLDRTSQETLESGHFVYAGVQTQLEVLQRHLDKNNKIDLTKEVLYAVEFLRKNEFSAEVGAAGGELYNQFKNGSMKLKSIQEGKLINYFGEYSKKTEEEQRQNPGPKYENKLLAAFFNIEEDRFLSLPLIQFANFDGVIHIIYKKRLSEKINKKSAIRSIVKLFSLEMESLLLNFDVVESNMFKASLLKYELDDLKSESFYEKFNRNPILKDLKYRKYYIENEAFFLARISQSDEVPKLILAQHRKNAIMSILIDSYAHNISAHSLTALNWWFYQRAGHLTRGEDRERSLSVDINPDIPLITSENPLAGEIHPLFKLLLEKGAFWTGLTRDRHFGGQISSLYTILRYDFVNNPLYLGTIAYSEGILKLNVEITVYDKVERVEKSDGIFRKKQIKKTKDGELLHGRFVTIDLKNINYDADQKKVDPNSLNSFLLQGEKFDLFERELPKYKIFFPGGVIGKHAFFTILENEIRNVKHYSYKQIEKMKTDGLTLSISVQEASYDDQKEYVEGYNHELYRIGVWLNHPTRLSQELLMERLDRLGSDIIDQNNYSPKLGGTYQDKVCSAMLFNNTFLSVQNQESDRDKKYYPWIKTGSGGKPENGSVLDCEVSLRKRTAPRFSASFQYFQDHYKPQNGYFKKFFHLWKGNNVFTPDKLETLNAGWENLSRFRFAHLPQDDPENYHKAKQAGVIRNISDNTQDIELAYHSWLKKWLKKEEAYRVRFLIKGQNVAQMIFDDQGVRFLNAAEIDKTPKEDKTRYQAYEQLLIPLAHGDQVDNVDQVCKYRSHGILQSRFCNGKKLQFATIAGGTAAELMEMLLTNVCIFDNRIANRVERSNKEILKNALNCAIFKERTETWEREKATGFSAYHYLVVHLSFIEAFRDENGFKKYSENDIGEFIRKEILQDKQINKENFILVITTGRGRTQWWTKLEEKAEYRAYTEFTTFRPIESLIKSIERAISIGDDFELKYRLTKILFGS